MEKSHGGFKACSKSYIDPYLNITVGHYNAHTDSFKTITRLLKRSKI